MVEKVLGSIARKFSSGTQAAYQTVTGMIDRMGQIKFDLDIEDDSEDGDDQISELCPDNCSECNNSVIAESRKSSTLSKKSGQTDGNQD